MVKAELKNQTFMSENRNAIVIQIYVAIIAYAPLKLYRISTHILRYRLKDLSTLVRTNLFTRPTLDQRMCKQKQLQLESSLQLSFKFTYV